MLLEKNYSLKAFKQNRNILILLTGCFLQKPLKTTAPGLPKIWLACFSSETQKMQAFPFVRLCACLLTETEETGDKNRDLS